jgi:hypothetical protein
VADKVEIPKLVVDNNDQPHSCLTALQHHFALSTIGGAIHGVDRENIRRVLSGDKKADLEFIKKADLELMMRRYLETLSIPANAKVMKNAIDDWWVYPTTKEYKTVSFSPKQTGGHDLNLWVGPTIEPAPGEYSTIDDFLYEVICDEDEALWRYLCLFLAHALQHPEDKPGIMLVLIGDEGAGKGFFFMLLSRIWGSTTIEVSDMSKVIGTFNKVIENKFWILLDEALFKGDKKAQDRLKSLVTEPTVQVEQKYEPSRTVESVHRFVATTNREQFSQIRSDDRRNVFLRVSNKHKQDHEYFAELHRALHDGVQVEAFVEKLTNLDLSEFNPRLRPATAETAQQKIRSLVGFQRYWYEVLYHADFSPRGGDYSSPSLGWWDADFIKNRDLIKRYVENEKTADRHESVQLQSVYKTLTLICPSAECGARDDNKRGVRYPTLLKGREEFVKFLGCNVDWPK